MAREDKSACTARPKRKADPVEQRAMPDAEARHRARAGVNEQDGGGKKRTAARGNHPGNRTRH